MICHQRLYHSFLESRHCHIIRTRGSYYKFKMRYRGTFPTFLTSETVIWGCKISNWNKMVLWATCSLTMTKLYHTNYKWQKYLSYYYYNKTGNLVLATIVLKLDSWFHIIFFFFFFYRMSSKNKYTNFGRKYGYTTDQFMFPSSTAFLYCSIFWLIPTPTKINFSISTSNENKLFLKP